MKRRFFQVASGLVCLGFLHAQAFSQKVLVIYNEGMPDNAAPAFLHHMHLGENATLFSVKSLPRADKEKLIAQGFTQVAVFDTFADPKDLEELHAELQKNADSHLFINLKEGDRRYHQKLSPAVASAITAIPRDISFLGIAASRLDLDLTEGGTLLDNGLSRTPSADGEAIKEYWYTKGSTEEVFVVIWNAKEIASLLHDGRNYREKLDSQVKFAAKDAKLYTVGPKKLALTAATTGITALHQAVLAAKREAAISLIESQKIDAEENIIRYSLFARPGSGLHAGELAEKLGAQFPFEITLEDGKVIKNGGSGPADQAGFSVKASFKEIKEYLTILVIEALAAAPTES